MLVVDNETRSAIEPALLAELYSLLEFREEYVEEVRLEREVDHYRNREVLVIRVVSWCKEEERRRYHILAIPRHEFENRKTVRFSLEHFRSSIEGRVNGFWRSVAAFLQKKDVPAPVSRGVELERHPFRKRRVRRKLKAISS